MLRPCENIFMTKSTRNGRLFSHFKREMLQVFQANEQSKEGCDNYQIDMQSPEPRMDP